MSAEQTGIHAPISDRTRWLTYASELVVIGVIYFVIAKLSLALALVHPNATPVWPPTGLALAVVLLRGYRVWPAIWLAAFAANEATAGSVSTSLAIATGNTLESVVAAYLINRWSGGLATFETPAGVARFALICFAPSTMISPTFGVVSLSLSGYADWANFATIWLTWWVGDLAGALLIAPVVVLWAKSPASSLERRELLRAAAVFLTAIGIGLIAFSPLLGRAASTGPLAFLAIVPLMWAALRRGQRDTATTVLILAAFAIWGTLSGGGPFARDNLNDSFLLLLAFLISISVPSLSLSANAATQARHEQYAKLVMLELSHRSKNLLAVVQSMARQVARHTANFDDFHTAFSARLSALADTHDLLVRREWRGVDIGEVMRTQLAPFRALSKTSLTLDGAELMLSPKIAEQIGLALHELATNATKHGAFSTPQGAVIVKWRMEAAGDEPAHLRIDWQETGGPVVGTPTRKGFGHMVITRLVPRALSGDASLDFLHDGLRWTIKIPGSTLMERDETPESVRRAL